MPLIIPQRGFDARVTGFAGLAVTLDGVNDGLTRGADLGGSDGDEMMAGAVLKINGGDGAEQTIIGAANNNLLIRKSDNKFRLSLVSPGAAGTIFLLDSTSTYLAGATWLTLLTSVKSSTGATHMFVNGVDDEGTAGGTGLGGDIDLTDTDWAVGMRTGGSNKLNADVAYTALWPTYYDLSNAATLAQFFADGKPTDWSLVGTPLILNRVALGGAAAAFAADDAPATGGAMSITGALALSAGTPWD